MPQKLSDLIRPRQGILIVLAVFCALVIGVLFVGLDNVPGISLAYLATAILMIFLIRKWRRIKKFLILFVVSLVGIFFLSFLHELVYDIAMMSGEITAWQKNFLDIYHIVISLIVAFACPVGMVIGAVGSVMLFLRRRRG